MRNILLLFILLLPIQINSQTDWSNPIIKVERVGSPLVETSPFVLKDRLYLLENHQKFWELSGGKPGERFEEDEIRIRDIEADTIVSIPLKNHGFGTVLVFNEKVYVFAGNYGVNRPWRQIQEISMISSSDLKHWTKPTTIYTTKGTEFVYNTAVCRGKDGFVMLVETNDHRWTPFTFKYYTSQDLINWIEVPGGVYGKDKYVGGPALYYEGDWYYTLFLEKVNGGYETKITRSKDLINWQDARSDRAFMTFDPNHTNIPLLDPDIPESNASDVELTYFNGQTIIYFTGSDQSTAGDLQWATFDGTPQELFEHFFKDENIFDVVVPEHKGDWLPVLLSSNDLIREMQIGGGVRECLPTTLQLAYQERQLGAFIHFGPATFINSDFMSVPASKVFNPLNIDAEQWVRTAISFGAEHIVLTVKHHNGFCLWPTKTTDYSVKSSPWKDGQGDIVAEFIAACKKYGVKPGFYISGGDMNYGCWSTGAPIGERKIVGDLHAYFPFFLEQLRELLTNYDDISIIWFDGAYDPFGWDILNAETMERIGTEYGDAIRSIIKHLQPQAVVFGGTQPDIRWSGSEQGWASYPLWNCVTEENWSDNWVGPQNIGWIPAEANIHTRNTWFWSPESDNSLKDSAQMFKAYLESVGRGANLLINMTPDTAGIIPEMEVKMLRNFGDTLKSYFGKPLSVIKYPEISDNIVELIIPEYKNIQFIEIEEELKEGQRIANYSLEYFKNGTWLNIVHGLSVGRKRLHQIELLTTEKIRMVINESSGDPVIKKFAAY